ncbi:MAG: winged helix-turn-helix domain-containing protein, partial [Myxococcales bacterium]|nr:winged helix-turn-helix domain-containing protein [Myxococcales bacterium]
MQLTLEIGTVDFETSTLDTPDGPRTLRPMELKLLEHLSREPGAVHSPQRLLHEVWGYVDGVETRTLYATVNRLRLAIERDPRHPTHVVTVPRLGYRFVSLGAPVASDLPRSTTDLVGRDRDLEALVDRMESVGSATLVGPAGVGKSRLALAWATGAGGRVVWCPLADAKDGPAAFRALAEALGLGPAGRSAEADVRAALAALGDATLVLDDADGVLEAVGSLPHARKLVTCRGEPGALPGEVFPLGPLDSDGVGSPAARLLEARVRDRDPAWRMPEGAPWAQPLLDALGGLPLALELAAPWLSVFSGEELVERVEHGRATLGRRGSDRHASLVASLHWSWPLLSPVERAVLVQVAVFSGSFDLQAAREVVELPSDELLHEVVLGLVE